MNKEIKITPNGIKQAIENLLNENEQLQKEIKILKENAEHNDKVVDKVNWENQELKSELETYNKGCSELRKIIEHKDEKIKELKKQLENTNEQIEYLRRSIERKEDTIIDLQNEILQQENQQLKDNWNKLKDYIVKEYYMYLPLEAITKPITILIDKMQELEKGDSNE